MLLNRLKVQAAMLLLCCACLGALASGLASATGPAEGKAGAAAKPKDSPPFRGKVVLFGVHRKLVRAGERGESDILKMNPDGTGVEKVVALEDAGRVSGRVSPDGRRLAYGYQNRADGGWETWVLEADGSRRKLGAGGEVVAWSADGGSLVCRAFRDADRSFENWVIDVKSGKRRALDLPASDGAEDWSPKGDALSVMAANRGEVLKHPTKGTYPLRQIDLTGADGSKPKRLTADRMSDNLYSRFSPDGSSVAHYERRHSADRTKVFEAFVVVKPGGGGRAEVIRNDRIGPDLRAVEAAEYPFPWCPSGPPCWSPDGKQLAGLMDNLRSAGGKVGEGRFALVFATLDGKMVRALDLKKLGFVFVGSVDWR